MTAPTQPAARQPALFTIVVLGLITGLGMGLRFYAIGAKTVWLDEAFSLWLARQPLVDMWAWLIKIDQHPPLYYTLLHYWILLFGDMQGTARTLSALCSGLAMPLFYGACRYLFPRRTAFLATLLLALSPFHIRYAQEVRMYALLTLSTAAALYFLLRVLFDEQARQQRWPWVGLALAQAAVMLTHNTATIFFPLALNVAIGGALLWQRWQGCASSLPNLNATNFPRRWLWTQGMALVGWLPWSIPFVIQAVLVDRAFWIGAPSFGLVYETLHNFNIAFLPAWTPFVMLLNLGWWLLAALGVRTLCQTADRAWLLLLLFGLPIGGELLVSLRRPIFSDRTLIWVTLPYLMLVAAGIEAIGQRIVKAMGVARRMNAASVRANRLKPVVRLGITGLLLVVGLYSVALHSYYVDFVKEEWANAAAYVAERVKPEETILFNATWVQLPFQYYFRHYEKTVALHGLPVDLFDRGVLEPQMRTADLPYMRDLLADQQSVWLIYSHDWYTDPQGLIPRELQRQMTLVEQRAFRGLQVMYYRRLTTNDQPMTNDNGQNSRPLSIVFLPKEPNIYESQNKNCCNRRWLDWPETCGAAGQFCQCRVGGHL